jgi:hypothetical protein
MSDTCWLWYHGTTKENVESIQRDGFHVGTYFSASLADALCMGGAYVFGVALPLDPRKSYWEWICSETVPPERIQHLRWFRDVQVLYYNHQVSKRLRWGDVEPCTTCDGHGELNYLDDGHCLLPQNGQNNREYGGLCPDCHGHGIPCTCTYQHGQSGVGDEHEEGCYALKDPVRQVWRR